MVYGGIRYDRCFDIRSNVCISPWYGHEDRYDIYADLYRFFLRIYRYRHNPLAAVLPS